MVTNERSFADAATAAATVLDLLRSALERCVFFCYPVESVDALGPFVEALRPTATQILSASHYSSCDDCVATTADEDWSDANPELYEIELAVFGRVFQLFGDFIENDVDESTDERVKRLYEVITGWTTPRKDDAEEEDFTVLKKF